MPQFSSRAVMAIRSFAQQMQMPLGEAAPDGSYSFAFDRAGLLSLTPSEDGTRAIISLKSNEMRAPSADDLRHYLTLAQRDPVTQLPISAGVGSGARGGGVLILAMNVPDARFDLQTIETCLDRLIELEAAAL